MDKSKVVILIVAAMLIAASATAGVFWYLNNTNKYHQVFLDKCTIDLKGAESLAIYDEPKSETKNTLSTMMIMDADSGPGHFIYKVDSEGNQTPAKIYDEGGKEVFPDRPPTHITDCDNILFFDFMDNDYDSYSKKSQDQYRCQLYAVNKETGKIYLVAQSNSGFSSGPSSQAGHPYFSVSTTVYYCGTTSSGTYVSLSNDGNDCGDGTSMSEPHYNGVYLITFENDLINLKQISPFRGELENSNNFDKPIYFKTHVFEDDYGTMIYYKDSGNYYVQSETMGIIKCNEYTDLGFGLCNNIVFDDVFPMECDKLLSNGTTEHISLTTEQSYRSAIYTYSTGGPLFNPIVYDDHARIIYLDHVVTIHDDLSVSDEKVPIDVNKSLFLKDVSYIINDNSVDIYSYRTNTITHVDLTGYDISYLKKQPSAEVKFSYSWDNGTYGCYYNVEKQMIVIEGVKGTFDTVTFCIYSNGYVSHDIDKFQPVIVQIAPLN